MSTQSVQKELIKKELSDFFQKNPTPKALEDDNEAVDKISLSWVNFVAKKLGIEANVVVKVYNKEYNDGLDLYTF